MPRRLTDWDPIMKRRREYVPQADGSMQVRSYYDVEDIVEANKASVANTSKNAPWGDMVRVASIPLFLYFRFQKEGIIDPNGDVTDEKRFLRLLDDPDWSKLRTRRGLLSR